ncbi:two-component regulator propeller domain-containing protein [Fulvivirgaceae bacterium BMA10]|uniref:histidine kinase n=1 Tax=Splendidivirga corallicola TaxID=3051826 RepID=A0ABT8KQL6_9BACT|nr:two-component regulator propeller domain-containing protein [Fulvivirgaceae bacterium BMA10]
MLNKRLKLIVVLILFIDQMTVEAQQHALTFEHLSISNGLSSNRIQCLFQDSKGLIWIGTDDGLNLYNGYDVSIYQHRAGELNSLSSSQIKAIAEDQSGDLWIATSKGLDKYVRSRNQFLSVDFNTNQSFSGDANHINTIYVDRKQRLWIGTKAGLAYLHANKIEYVSNFAARQKGKDHAIFSIAENDQGNLVLGTANGLMLFSIENSTLQTYLNEFTIQGRINKLYIDKQRQLWIGTTSGPYSWNRSKKELRSLGKELPALNNEIIDVQEDQNEAVWFATSDGLLIYDPEKNKVQHHQKNVSIKNSLLDNKLSCILRDKKGDMWLGTDFRGVNIHHQDNYSFLHYQAGPTLEGLKGQVISAIKEDKKGNLWMATEDAGLNYFIQNEQRFINLDLSTRADGIEHNSIRSLELDGHGNLWIGTLGAGLSYYDINKKYLIKYSSQYKSTISGDHILALRKDHQDNLWIGTENGLDILRENSGGFHHLTREKVASEDDAIYAIFEDSKNNIWIGTGSNGLQLFLPKQNKFARYRHDEKDPHSISSNKVLCIFEDSKGQLWIGTEGGGLNLFYTHDKTFLSFNHSQGSLANTVFGILEDDQGNLWLSTNRGVLKFDPQERQFQNFQEQDGLQSDQFNYNSYLKTSRGEIIFGGMNGFNIFNPEDVRKNAYQPPIVLTDLFVNNVEIEPGDTLLGDGHISELKELILGHDQNDIRIGVAALNYTFPKQNRYAYQLSDYNTQWVENGTNRFFSFINLVPGSYTLKVKAANNDNVWSVEPIALRITVLSPWWQTQLAWLAYLLLALTIFLIARNIIMSRLKLRHQLKLERLKHEQAEELYQSKLKFFTNISHEFRTPLTMILGPVEDLLKKEENKQQFRQFRMMEKNAKRLLRLIDQLLDFNKIKNGKLELNATEDDLIEFLQNLVEPFFAYAQHQHINFKLDVPDSQVILYFDKEMMDKIIYNLLSNAFKFTDPEGQVLLKVKEQDGCVAILVEDTGCGIPEEEISTIFERFALIQSENRHHGTGIGLELTKELVELHQGTIKVESVVGSGSRFTIELPKSTLSEAKRDIPVIRKEVSQQAKKQIGPLQLPSTDVLDSDRRKPGLLIVEDHDELREYVKSTFEQEYKIYEASNGVKGLEIAQKTLPDLVISDVAMPEMNGFLLCQKIKENLSTSHIPVILLTARVALEHQIEGAECGADIYLTKPFSTRHLKIKVDNLIENRKKLRHKFQTLSKHSLEELCVNSPDEQFLEGLTSLIKGQIDDAELSIEHLAKEIGLSRSQFYRKLKALTGYTPHQYLQLARLKHASHLLSHSQYSIAEVAYLVGFNDPKYFTKCFKEYFGKSPLEFKKEVIGDEQ